MYNYSYIFMIIDSILGGDREGLQYLSLALGAAHPCADLVRTRQVCLQGHFVV